MAIELGRGRQGGWVLNRRLVGLVLAPALVWTVLGAQLSGAADGPNDPIVEASEKAAATGESVVVDALTTEHEIVSANPDGGLTSEVSAFPARVVDDAGGWQAVDSTLVAADDGTIHPVATSVATRMCSNPSANGRGTTAERSCRWLSEECASSQALVGRAALHSKALPWGFDPSSEPVRLAAGVVLQPRTLLTPR